MTNELIGYERYIRDNGSEWFLCDYCEHIAFLSVNKKTMIKHLKEKHPK